jgi:hypothetical protein
MNELKAELGVVEPRKPTVLTCTLQVPFEPLVSAIVGAIATLSYVALCCGVSFARHFHFAPAPGCIQFYGQGFCLCTALC